MVVGFITTYVISVYENLSCGLEFWPGKPRYNWNIVESYVKYHNPHPQSFTPEYSLPLHVLIIVLEIWGVLEN